MRVALLAVLSVGCVSQAALKRNDPPARLTVGAATRHFAAPIQPDSTGAFRTATPPPKVLTESHQAAMGTIAFTMAMPYGTYAGGEIETGVLTTADGSSASAVYGVLGARQMLSRLNLGAELAAGPRWIRYGNDADDFSQVVLEPRLRADLWLDERFTFGAVAGLTLGDQTIWMAGLFFGIHSHDFGGRTR